MAAVQTLEKEDGRQAKLPVYQRSHYDLSFDGYVYKVRALHRARPVLSAASCVCVRCVWGLAVCIECVCPRMRPAYH
jgi:hypothetical protein